MPKLDVTTLVNTVVDQANQITKLRDELEEARGLVAHAQATIEQLLPSTPVVGHTGPEGSEAGEGPAAPETS